MIARIERLDEASLRQRLAERTRPERTPDFIFAMGSGADPKDFVRTSAWLGSSERKRVSDRMHIATHVSVSVGPGEDLAREQWITVAERVRSGLGLDSTAALALQPGGGERRSLDVFLGIYEMDGGFVSGWNESERLERTVRSLEKELGLWEGRRAASPAGREIVRRAERARREVGQVVRILERGSLTARETELLAAGTRPPERWGRDGVVGQLFERRLQSFPEPHQELMRSSVKSAARRLETSPELAPHVYLDAVREAKTVDTPGWVIGRLGRIAKHHGFAEAWDELRERALEAGMAAEILDPQRVEALRITRDLHRGLYEESLRLMPEVAASRRDDVLRAFEGAARQLAVARAVPESLWMTDLQQWRRDLVSGARSDLRDYLWVYREVWDERMWTALPRIEAAYQGMLRDMVPTEGVPVGLGHLRQYGQAQALQGFLARRGNGPVQPLVGLNRARTIAGTGGRPMAVVRNLSQALGRTVVENAILGSSEGAQAMKTTLRVARGAWLTAALDSMKQGLSR